MNNVCALRHRKIRRRVPGRPLVLEKATLILEGQTITYTLKRSRNARLIWLNYKAAEGLQVTVPEHYSLKDLPDFLKRNSQWILRQKSKREAELQLVLSLPQHPDSVLFLGKPLLLKETQAIPVMLSDSVLPADWLSKLSQARRMKICCFTAG